MSDSFVFSSESVGVGHPDKVADYISDSILDSCLSEDKESRVACETLVKSNRVILAGEITTRASIDYDKVVRRAVREIGYTYDDDLFHADRVSITNLLTRQSEDIARGVDVKLQGGEGHAEQGAGDQGMMFGFACRDTPEMMPAPITYAHRLCRGLARLRQVGDVKWLRPDCKAQVAVRYEKGIPSAITTVVVSTQHTPDIEHRHIKAFCIDGLIKKELPERLLNSETKYFVNPTGRFVSGGPEADSGLTGRKIIVDTYGGWSRHGGGAFSGKDPSKVDRSAAYMCRWVAKNIVAAGIAGSVELQVAYAIGHPHPTSIYVDTFGSGRYSDATIVRAVRAVFSFKPADIISQLRLLRPIYRKTTHYGHFAKPGLPWEDTSKAEELLEAVRSTLSDR